ncbi:protein phosphatase 2C domain-containing protein [Streptomyces pseudogriseolus]|uniref:PP2C family serine/threonine-protein phosphatase n=1 Tax=Streptomyces pseudogriseolus TaxID=36817 RepID=UPI003FA1D6AB
MPQQAALSKCPSCEEPLESGDRFCGACGYDLSVVPARPVDEPTLTMTGVPPQTPWPSPAHPGTRPPGPAAPPPPATPPVPSPGTTPAGQGPHAPAPGCAPAHPGAADPHAAPAGAPGAVPSGHAATQRPADVPSTGAPAHPGATDPHFAASAPHTPAPGASTPGAPPTAPPAQSASAAPTAPQGAPSTGVRFDRPAQPEVPAPQQPAQADDYTLQAPDPRVADAAEAPAQGGGPGPAVCVACRAGRVDDDGYCENCGHAQPRERDHMEQECGPLAAVSDRGLRHHRNEDAFAVGTTTLPDGSPVSVAVVCDGVSSATRPDEASLAASRAANASLLDALPRGTHPQQAMHEAILAASEAVNALADEQPAEAREHAPQQNAPACTIVGAVVTAGLLVVGWVGDSRAYWIPVDRSAPPARLTEDDSWAAQMVAAGLMGEAEAYADHRAHAITGWLGADAYELEPHTAAFKPDRPGVVVVCTDGLWNYAESADEMAEAVPVDAAARPLHAARVLVGHALDGGGHDNVTVALVPFPAVPQGAGSA